MAIPQSKTHQKSDQEQVIVQILFRLFILVLKSFMIQADSIEFSIYDSKIQLSSTTLKFNRTNSFNFDVDFENCILSNTSFTVDIPAHSLHESLPISPTISLLTMDQIVLPLSYQCNSISFSVNDTNFSLSYFSVTLSIPKGDIVFSLPTISGKFNKSCPNLSFTVSDLKGFHSTELFHIPQLDLQSDSLSFQRLTIENSNRKLLTVSDFDFHSSKGFHKFLIQKLQIDYHTKTGLEIFPHFSWFFKRRASRWVPTLLPNYEIKISNICLDMYLTDTCQLHFECPAILSNETVRISRAEMLWNGVSSLISKRAKIDVTEDKFLRVNLGRLHFHDRRQMVISDYVGQVILAWKAVSPYIVKNYLDTETLPFPLIVCCRVFKFKFHPNDLHAGITRATSVSKGIILDGHLRHLLMEKKISGVSNADISTIEKKLKQLQFSEFRKKINETPKYKYLLEVIFYQPSLSFDCRDFTQKVSMIHQFDPTTRQLYPDMQWDLMMGANFEFKGDLVTARYADVPEFICKMTKFSYTGPTILAEAKSEPYLLPMTVDGETMMVDKNPCDIKMFTDMVWSAEDFMCYITGPFDQIWQDIGELGSNMIPLSSRSPSRKYWDMFRSQFRGQYLMKFSNWELRYPGSEDYHDTDNFSPIRVIKFNMVWKECDALFTAEKWTSPRYYQGKPGPLFFELPHIVWSFKYKWVCGQDDYKKHFIFPKIGDEDSFEKFRATEIIMDSTISYSDSEDSFAMFNVDIAHFQWMARPLLLFMQDPVHLRIIKHKYGAPQPSNLKVTQFKGLHRHGFLKMISDSFIVRVFDHFPMQQVRGSSIDFRIHDFKALFTIDLNAKVTNIDMNANSLTLNTTDISHYTSGKSESPTFLLLENLHVNTETKEIEAEEVTGHFNQLFLQYIKEFRVTVGTIISTLPSKKAKQENEPFSVSIHNTQFFLTSMETDIQLLLIMTNIGLKGKQFKSQEIQFFTNSKDGQYGEEVMALVDMTVNMPKDQLGVKIEKVTTNFESTDFSAVIYMINECDFSFESSMYMRVQLDLPRVEICLNLPNGKCLANLDNSLIVVSTTTDGSEYSVIVGAAAILNLSDGALFKEVWAPWSEQLSTKHRRQIHMEIKQTGQQQFSQVEINVEPTTVHYETPFREAVISFFKQEMVKRPNKVQFAIHSGVKPLPFTMYKKDDMPNMSNQFAELFSKEKSKSIIVKAVEDKSQLQIAYFRVNPISMCVSYRNPDSHLEINNFQGQIHEVIFHDLQMTVMELVEKISFGIAGDMIPQFLKHIVGIKKPGINPDLAIEEWLHSKDDKMSQQDKQRILLFGAKTVKKK